MRADNLQAEDTVTRVMAYFKPGNGPSVAGCLERVTREAAEEQAAIEKNVYEVEGITPSHIFTHKGKDGRVW